MAFDHNRRTAGELLTNVIRHMTDLVRGEFALARAEVADNVRRARGGLIMIAAAAVTGMIGLTFMSAAAVAALMAQGLGAGWAALIVGGALFLIATLLVHEGLGALDRTNFIPRRAARHLRRDSDLIKEKIHDTSL